MHARPPIAIKKVVDESNKWVLDKGPQAVVNYEQYGHAVAKPGTVISAKTGQVRNSSHTIPNGINISKSQRFLPPKPIQTTQKSSAIYEQALQQPSGIIPIAMQKDKLWVKPTTESIIHTQIHQQQKSDILMNEMTKRQTDVKKQAVNSAAIQDHFMRNLKLDGINSIGGIKPRRVLSTTGANIIKPQSAKRQTQKQADSNVEQILNHAQQMEMDSYKNIEKKRLDYINKLTLGQRLGLFEKPNEPLSHQQWQQIEQVTLKRRQVECAICCENLNFSEQTILSCSHVFHKVCFQSFEKFIKSKKGERACPLCRMTAYDSKPFVEGQRRYLIRQCTTIQSLARGFLQRNAFYTMMKDMNYRPNCEDMRKRLIGFKLSLISKRQRVEMHNQRVKAGLIIEQSTKTVIDSEKLLASYFPNVMRQLRQKQQPKQEMQTEEQKLDAQWDKVKQQALTRGDTDCAICFNPLNMRRAVLLSCSHVFHDNCIANFERFEREADQNQYDGIGGHQFECSCPMCRMKGYKKIQIKL